MIPTTRQVWRSMSFQPLTALYLCAVAVIMAITAGVVTKTTGIIVLGFVAMLIALLAMHRELRQVHLLVDTQHAAMVDRITQLVDELHRSGVDVPPYPDPQGGGDQ